MRHIKRVAIVSFSIYFLFAPIPWAFAQSNETEVATNSDTLDSMQTHPYYPAFKYWSDKNVINGHDFSKDPLILFKTIKRDEFITIVMKAAGYKGGGKNCYEDIKNNKFQPFICEAKEKGFIKNDSKKLFYPSNSAEFKEVAFAIVKAFKLNKNLKKNNIWYKPYIIALEKLQAIPVSVLNFEQPITFGILSEILWRINVKGHNKNSSNYEILKNLTFNLDLLKKDSITELPDDVLDVFLDGAIEEFHISVEENKEILSVIDDKTIARKIKFLADIFDIFYNKTHSKANKGGNKIFLKIYKNVAFILIPRLHRFEIFNPSVIDASTAKLIGHFSRGDVVTVDDVLFLIDKNNLYSLYQQNGQFEINGLDTDAKTFKHFNIKNKKAPILFKDKKHVYFVDKKQLYTIDGADSKTFKKHGKFFTDAQNVYFFDKKDKQFKRIENVDPKTFDFKQHEKELF